MSNAAAQNIAAQSDEVRPRSTYAAVASSLVSFEGHFGFEDALGPDSVLRLRANLTPFITFGVAAGADALFDLGTIGTSSVYGGGGLSLGYEGVYNFGGPWNLALLGTVGYEAPLNSFSLIAEFSTGVGYSFGLGGSFYPPVRAVIGFKFPL